MNVWVRLWISILAFFTLALWYIFANVYIDTLVPVILKVQTGPMTNSGQLSKENLFSGDKIKHSDVQIDSPERPFRCLDY